MQLRRLLVALPVLLLACGDSGDTSGSGAGTPTAATGTGAASTGSDAGGSGGTGGSSGAFMQGEVVSIAIDPPAATLVVDGDTLPPPTAFRIVGTTTTNAQVELSGTWFFDRPDVATVSNAGAVSATGLLGGKGVLQAEFNGLKATADVTVKLKLVDDTLAVDPGTKALFDTPAGPDPSLNVLYPYDKTVFPRGLLGPELQWSGGNANDIYRIQFTSETFEFVTWTTAAPPSRYAFPVLPKDIWRLLTNSTAGTVEARVQRYDGTVAYEPKLETWTIAPANLAGTIYYWEINQGNVVRLKPGQEAPENFLQKPPGVTCVACHSVSADGGSLVASFNGGYSPWGTFEPTTGTSTYSSLNQYPTPVNPGRASGFQAISPNGSHILYGQSQGSATLTLSTNNDATSLTGLTTPVGAPVHPTWSVDGKQVAYGVRTNGNWLDFTSAALFVADVDLNVPAFGNQVEIVAAGADGYAVNTYPSYSPDSKWIAFQRSNQARTRGALGEVWLTRNDGSTRVRLDATNGTGLLSAVQAQATYQPTFLPVAVGGYFWLVAESERVYGNRLTDENPVTRRKQLWVSAIDPNAPAGVDPSHPAFWLPGQELTNQNMRGAWSLDPCKGAGESCEAGFECCEGYCVYDPNQADYVCGEQQGCSPDGSACQTAADCCDPNAECINGFCSAVAQ
jgi:hypothetical protein